MNTSALPNGWRRLPTTTLETMLEALDDSSDDFDDVADEVARREEDAEHVDAPSLTLPTYTT